MLVLAQKPKQVITIGDNIRITVMQVDGNRVTLGIDAPKTIAIRRVPPTPVPTQKKVTP